MAKRVRGSSIRPGQRPPTQRTSTRPATAPAPAAAVAPSAPKPTGLTADEEARAAVIEARIVAEETAAEAGRSRSAERRRDPEPSVGRASGPIAQRAAEEYAYVGRDVRRITLIGGSLILLMIVLWIIANASGASPI
jgi:uncharacterized membrane protein